jgi:tetratricopeptide (TPR) repeat protein
MKPLHYILICCFLGLSLVVSSQKDSQYYLDKGHGIVGSWFYFSPKRAHRAFSKAIEIDSTNISAYASRASVYIYQMKEKELGKRDLTKALFYTNLQLAKAPSDSLYWGRGSIKIDAGDFESGCEDLIKAGELGKSSHNYYCIEKKHLWIESNRYVGRGNKLSNKKKYSEAITEFSTAIEIDPNNYIAYYNRGETRKQRKDFELSIKDFNTGIELTTKRIESKPKDSKAYFYRGRLKQSTGDIVGACLDFKKARELGYSVMKLIDKKLCKN